MQSQLGGKYSLRAYGNGRYIDRGMAALNVEQRFKVYEAKTAGVTTELQLAPFIGVGEVFDNPERASSRYARPVLGAAIRAVAKPQVVGSVDFGVGREGLAVFMDINAARARHRRDPRRLLYAGLPRAPLSQAEEGRPQQPHRPPRQPLARSWTESYRRACSMKKRHISSLARGSGSAGSTLP